jgi:hypothetical protein
VFLVIDTDRVKGSPTEFLPWLLSRWSHEGPPAALALQPQIITGVTSTPHPAPALVRTSQAPRGWSLSILFRISLMSSSTSISSLSFMPGASSISFSISLLGLTVSSLVTFYPFSPHDVTRCSRADSDGWGMPSFPPVSRMRLTASILRWYCPSRNPLRY